MCGCLMKSKLPVPSDKKQPLDEDPRGLRTGNHYRAEAAAAAALGQHNTTQKFYFQKKIAQMKQNTTQGRDGNSSLDLTLHSSHS